jgi:hypothetical protein
MTTFENVSNIANAICEQYHIGCTAKVIEFHKPTRFIPAAPKWRAQGELAKVIEFRGRERKAS